MFPPPCMKPCYMTIPEGCALAVLATKIVLIVSCFWIFSQVGKGFWGFSRVIEVFLRYS